MNIGGSISGAAFNDESHRFRYALWRIWDKEKDALLFIGLNSSTATDRQDDPTIRRVASFAVSWGFGGLFVGNLFSIVSPDPSVIKLDEPLESPNDAAIRCMRGICGAALVGWGHFGKDAGPRPAEVLAILGKPVYCLGLTKDGWPKHPLYVLADTQMKLYERGTK